MSFPDGSKWSLQYPDARSDTRMLTSLPKAMLLDAQCVAAAEGISTAELNRRALTAWMAAHSAQGLMGKPRT